MQLGQPAAEENSRRCQRGNWTFFQTARTNARVQSGSQSHWFPIYREVDEKKEGCSIMTVTQTQLAASANFYFTPEHRCTQKLAWLFIELVRLSPFLELLPACNFRASFISLNLSFSPLSVQGWVVPILVTMLIFERGLPFS